MTDNVYVKFARNEPQSKRFDYFFGSDRPKSYEELIYLIAEFEDLLSRLKAEEKMYLWKTPTEVRNLE